MIAGVLEVQLLANLARLQRDMTEAKGMVGSAMQGIERSVSLAKSAFAALGVGIGAAGLLRLVKDAIDAGDALAKMSQRTGVAVEELSKLKHAGNLSDVSIESLGKGLKGLSQRMTEAAVGTSEAGRLMKALGVDINGGAAPAIEKIADIFAQLPDGTTKAALAVDVFGKAGLDMIPMLNQGAEGLRRMKDEAVRLGIVMDEETAKSAEIFKDNMTAAGAATERLGVTVANIFAPSLVRVSKAIKEAATESGILAAVWVAMGGVAAEALGLNATEMEKTKKHIREIEAEILTLRQVEATDLGGGVYDRARFIAAQERIKVLHEELRVVEQLRVAQAGGFQDQVSRSQQHGAGIVGGTNSDLEARIKSILALGDATEKTAKAAKELALADEHVTFYMKELAKLDVARVKRLEEQAAAEDALNKIRFDAQDSFEALVEQMEFEVTLLGKSNADRQIAIALRQLEKAGIDATNPSLKAYVDRIREAVEAQEAFRGQQEVLREQASVWSQLGDVAGSFFSDLVMNGKDAFDNLKRYAKDLLAQMLALFAKKWLLQIGAALTGSASLAAMAGQVGQGTLAGAAGNWLGSTALGSAVSGAGSSFLGGWNAVTGAGEAGVSAIGANGFAGTIGETMASGYQWLLTNSYTAAAAIAVIAAIAISRMRSGGPKEGGSFFGGYDATGAYTGSLTVPGSDNGRFYTPSGGDSTARQWGDTAAGAFFDVLRSLGGSSTGIQLGFGYDKDPAGTADSRVSAMVRDASGNVVYSHTQSAGRDDEDFQRAMGLETRRVVLAALQNSVLPQGIAAILSLVEAASATAEDIDAILRLADAFGTLSQALSEIDIGSIIADASRNSADIFRGQGEALMQLANRTSLTVDSLNSLTQATNIYRQSTAQLIIGLESAKLQISDMFAETGRNIRLAGLDDQGKYNFFQAESERLFGQIGGASTAEEIQRITSLINQDINSAFGLLSPEQQVSMQSEWLTRLDNVNMTAQGRLAQLQEDAARQANETLGRIEKIMDDLATKQSIAADKNMAAADTQLEAANTDRTINVNVSLDGGAIVTSGG